MEVQQKTCIFFFQKIYKMKEFYTRLLTSAAYVSVLLIPLFINEYLFYFVGFICSLILVFEFIKLITNYNHKFLSTDAGKSNLILYLTFPLYISLFLLSYNWIFQLFFLLLIIITNILLGFSLLKKKYFPFLFLKIVLLDIFT